MQNKHERESCLVLGYRKWNGSSRRLPIQEGRGSNCDTWGGSGLERARDGGDGDVVQERLERFAPVLPCCRHRLRPAAAACGGFARCFSRHLPSYLCAPDSCCGFSTCDGQLVLCESFGLLLSQRPSALSREVAGTRLRVRLDRWRGRGTTRIRVAFGFAQ